MYEFYVGNEDRCRQDQIDWVKEHFPQEAYGMYDKGWMYSEYYIRFNREEDALLFRLRWDNTNN